MARKPHTQKDSSSAISAIEKRIRFLKRKLIRMIQLNLASRIPAISQNIERLTQLLAHKKTDKALRLQTRFINSLVASLPRVPVMHGLVEGAGYVAGAPAAAAGAPAVIPMEVEAQDVEMFNPDWGMVTPVAQLAPAAFPEFNEDAIPSTPQDQMIHTPEHPPALVMPAPLAPLSWLAPPAIAVQATPQAQIFGAPVAPPALVQPPRYVQRGLYTPPRQIIRGNPTEPPRRERPSAFA